LKNKVSAIFFIVVLFAPCTGTYLWLLNSRRVVRQQVNENIMNGIDTDRLVVLGFTKEETETELRWEHPAEFEYMRQMYDIVETKLAGDSIYYTCWWDIEETLINNRISELGKYALDTEAQKNDRKDNINTWFRLVFIPESRVSGLKAQFIQSSRFFEHADIYNSLAICPPKPPPRLT